MLHGGGATALRPSRSCLAEPILFFTLLQLLVLQDIGIDANRPQAIYTQSIHLHEAGPSALARRENFFYVTPSFARRHYMDPLWRFNKAVAIDMFKAAAGDNRKLLEEHE